MAQSLVDFVANLKRITELDVSDGNNPNDEMFGIMASSISEFVESSDQTDEILEIIENNQEEVINIIDGINTEVDDLRQETLNAIDDILAIRDLVDGEFKPQLNLEILSRKESDKALFDTAASLAEFRRKSSEFENDITDAIFEVNPDNGTIGLRAYSYTDEAFSQAGILIDGVNAEVSIQAGRITDLGNEVQDANAEINVLAGEIELKASYTEMTEYVSGALDAIIPAYSFSFFDSAEGWTAVNGTISEGASKIITTWGDIQNTNLNYSADDNPVITLTCERLAGSGYTGDLVVYFDNAPSKVYNGVISDTGTGSVNVKTLNLSEEADYTGTVTGIRLILGESVSDEFEITSITIGKPSAQLEALDGITAQVNQLGIDVDAIEGQLTSFVTTTFYDENTVTLNNVTQVLDGEEAIISLRATQNELNDQGTITKANSASFWVDAAEANVTTTITSFNAVEGGIDDQLAGLTGSVNTINEELSTIDGASIRTQLLSINRLEIESGDLEEAQFYTELKLLDQKNRNLELGNSVATVDTQTKALATDTSALAQQITELTASIGTVEGQVDANATFILNTDAKVDGNAQSIAGLITDVESAQGDIASAELLLDSTVDELGVVSSRAYLGVSDVVAGKREVTGVTFDSLDNGIRFKGDVFELATTSGNTALFYDADVNEWKFNGRLVIGGYEINNEGDIRALDGDTIYEVYQYSVDGSTGWHTDFVTGDIFRRTATVTNGDQSAWSTAARITGETPVITPTSDGYIISNGTETVQIYDGTDGESAPVPTITDNGDGTVTIDNGDGESATIADGADGYSPVLGVDYFDGASGDYVSNVYKTATSTPTSPSGGSFNGSNETLPSGYQDTPYYTSGQITYISTARYKNVITYDGNGNISSNTWVNQGWSSPIEYIIQGESGEDGTNGDTIYEVYRYSVNGVDNWHTEMQTGDVFRQTATVTNGVQANWSASARIAGFDGENGKDAITNLIDPSDEWVIGTSGSQGGYTQSGSEFNNEVRNIEGPNGVNEPVWVSQGTYTGAAGGWTKTISGQNPSKSYRYSLWARKRPDSDSRLYFGCQDALNVGLSANSNPYFSSNVNLPSGDKWYLLVGVVHGNNGSAATNTNTSGVYDPDTGMRVQGFSEFVNDTSTTTLTHRVFRRDANNYHDTRFARPRIDLIDGNEPSISDLINRIPTNGVRGAGRYETFTTTGAWSQSVAEALLPSEPVEGDIVTIFKTGDPSVSNTRKYDGSSWVAYALVVNGNALINGSVDGEKFNSATTITAGTGNDSVTLDGTGGDYVFYTGTNAATANTKISKSGILEMLGAKFATASSGDRIEIEDDGTYLIWIGSGSKNDSNATFFVKKNGTGFIKGEFFQGQILRERFGSSTTNIVTASGHLSAGNPIRLTSTISFRDITETSSNVSSVPIDLTYTLKRGSTTVKSGTLYPNRVVIDNGGESGVPNRVIDNLVQTLVVEDTGATAGQTYSYTLTIESISGATYDLTLSTYENLIG